MILTLLRVLADTIQFSIPLISLEATTLEPVVPESKDQAILGIYLSP
jgi:hypothetical protein